MPVDNQTPNRGYDLPAAGNDLDYDVARLISALQAVDVDVQTILGLFTGLAALESPTFSGSPSAPTPAASDNSARLGTTAFVQAAIAAAIAGIGGGGGGAPLESPNFTGIPTAPTATAGNNTTQISTTAFVHAAISAAIGDVINGAPGALDTLNELADALGDDPNFATTITNALAAKLDSSRTITAGDGLDGGGDLTADRTLSLIVATLGEFRNATTGSRALTPENVWGAAAEVSLGGGSNITPNFDLFFNGVINLTGNRTLNNGTNGKVGQNGYIRVVQDATGSRSLSYGTNYEFSVQTPPVLSTAANAEDLLFYTILSPTRVFIASALDIG